ncbi:hypothetical protein BY458DRAFT_544318 [Sporodiniella umbellata]|nr:hypothetical protein BY458DRAFT_544318 [Sporodiniella umbellata]
MPSKALFVLELTIESVGGCFESKNAISKNSSGNVVYGFPGLYYLVSVALCRKGSEHPWHYQMIITETAEINSAVVFNLVYTMKRFDKNKDNTYKTKLMDPVYDSNKHYILQRVVNQANSHLPSGGEAEGIVPIEWQLPIIAACRLTNSNLSNVLFIRAYFNDSSNNSGPDLQMSTTFTTLTPLPALQNDFDTMITTEHEPFYKTEFSPNDFLVPHAKELEFSITEKINLLRKEYDMLSQSIDDKICDRSKENVPLIQTSDRSDLKAVRPEIVQAHTAGFIRASLLFFSERYQHPEIKSYSVSRIEEYIKTKLQTHSQFKTLHEAQEHIQIYINAFIKDALASGDQEKKENDACTQLENSLGLTSTENHEIDIIHQLIESDTKKHLLDRTRLLQERLEMENIKREIVRAICLKTTVDKREQERQAQQSKELNELDTQRQSLESERERHEQEKSRLDEEKRMLEKEKAALEKDKTDFDQHKLSFESNQAKIEKEQKTDLESEKTRLGRERSDLNEQKTTFESEKSQLEAEKSAVNELKTVLECEKTEFEKEKMGVEDQKTELNTERERLEKEKSNMAEQKVKFDEEKEILEKSKLSLTDQKKDLESERAVLIKELSTLNIQKNAFEQEKAELEKEKVLLSEQKTNANKEESLNQNNALEKEKDNSEKETKKCTDLAKEELKKYTQLAEEYKKKYEEKYEAHETLMKEQKNRFEQAKAENEYIKKAREELKIISRECRQPVRGSKRKAFEYVTEDEESDEESVEQKRPVKSTRRAASGTAVDEAQPVESKPTLEDFLQKKDSPLSEADMKDLVMTILGQLTSQEKESLAAYLPEPDLAKPGEISEEFLTRGNNVFWECTDTWQALLSAGSFDPDFKPKKPNNEIKDFKDDQYEQYWGEKVEKALSQKNRRRSSRR